jgi:hypothetical protein
MKVSLPDIINLYSTRRLSYSAHLSYTNQRRDFVSWRLAEHKHHCPGCGRFFGGFLSNGRNAVSIDHHHDTDVVRDILCQRCNAILGGIEGGGSATIRPPALLRYLARHGRARKRESITGPEMDAIVDALNPARMIRRIKTYSDNDSNRTF